MSRNSASLLAPTLLLIGLGVGGALCVPEPEKEEQVPSSAGKIIKALCDRNTRCEAEIGRSFISEEACVDLYNDLSSCGIFMDFGFFEYELRTGWRESGAGECIAWLETADCTESDGATPCDDITYVVDGLAEGESCQFDFRGMRVCSEGLYCDEDQPEGTCPVCAAKPGVGGSCSFEGVSVPCQDSYCDASDNRCKALKASGLGCSNDAECESLWCRSGTCAERLERNASCGEDDWCRGSLRCHEGVCTDKAAPGAPCSDGGDCLGPAVCFDGSCVQVDLCSWAEVGDPCLSRCEEGAYCSAGRCVTFRGEGETCTGTTECGFPEAACDSDTSTCVAYQDLGEPCDADRRCQLFEGYCDTTSDPANWSCAPAKEVGQPCGNALECASLFCDAVSDTCAWQADSCDMP